MATISTRVDDATLEKLEYIEQSGPFTRSDALRRCIEYGYDRIVAARANAAPPAEYEVKVIFPNAFDVADLLAAGWRISASWFDHNVGEPRVLLERRS